MGIAFKTRFHCTQVFERVGSSVRLNGITKCRFDSSHASMNKTGSQIKAVILDLTSELLLILFIVFVFVHAFRSHSGMNTVEFIKIVN